MNSSVSNFIFRRLFDTLSIPSQKLNILIYHRVLAEPDPLRPWEIDARRFEQHLSWMASIFNVLPLKEAIHALHSNQLPRRSLCVTFDDGYLDNVEVALPLLNRYKMPATFFCTSAFLDGDMMWNDQVIEAVRNWPSKSLDIPELNLSSLSLNNSSDQAKSIETILNTLKYTEQAQRTVIAQQLLTESSGKPPRQMMSADEIRILHKQGMEIGGHTHSHPILANLDTHNATREIQLNKEILESIIEDKITSFAYPNGKPGKDYRPQHCDLVAKSGYELAVSTSPGVSLNNSNRYQLSRFTPWDQNKEKFLARLAINNKDRAPGQAN